MGFMDFLGKVASVVEKRAVEIQDEWKRKCTRMSDSELLQYYYSTSMKTESNSSMLLEIIKDELRRRHIRF